MPRQPKSTTKRPPGRPAGITKYRVSVSLTKELHKAAVLAALELDMSFSAFVAKAISSRMNLKKAKP